MLGGLDQPLCDHLQDDVGDQIAVVHGRLGRLTDIRARLDLGTEEVTAGDVLHPVVLGQALGLGSFAGAGSSKHQQSHGVPPGPPTLSTA